MFMTCLCIYVHACKCVCMCMCVWCVLLHVYIHVVGMCALTRVIILRGRSVLRGHSSNASAIYI